MKKPIVLTFLAFAAILALTGFLILPDRPAAEADVASGTGLPPASSREALVTDAAARFDSVLPASEVPPREYPGTGLKTYSPSAAIREARDSGKYVLLYFWATWCGNCSDFDANTLPDKTVVENLNSSFALVPLDYDRSEEMVRLYRIRAVPTFIFIDPEAKPVTVLPGAVPADIFAAVLSYVSTGSYKSMDFEEYATSL
ncbi:MAG: thioredoxin family protein [Deltaproteobacteria bacterium]|jgi:thiol:disulfide interchange protein|nr:thioredoxin family protein [Deltaproteobacteria bacterium]